MTQIKSIKHNVNGDSGADKISDNRLYFRRSNEPLVPISGASREADELAPERQAMGSGLSLVRNGVVVGGGGVVGGILG